jgi:5'-deoxynucleotidase YfbR-like HD superfamily hydrolase
MSKLLDHMRKSLGLAGRVTRYHTHPYLREQSVAEHSHRVITLYVELFGLPRAEVLYYAAIHDLGEVYAGDTPFTAKRELPELKDAVNKAEKVGFETLGIQIPILVDEEWDKFKICDLLDIWEYNLFEYFQGNTFAIVVMENIEEGLKMFDDKVPALYEIATGWMRKKKVQFYG